MSADEPSAIGSAIGRLIVQWQFWQLLVSALTAFLGFALAAWLKYLFDLCAERRRHKQLVRSTRVALTAEIATIRDAIAEHTRTMSRFEDLTIRPVHRLYLDIPHPVIFPALADRIGMLPDSLARDFVRFYGACDSLRRILTSPQDLATSHVEDMMRQVCKRGDDITAEMQELLYKGEAAWLAKRADLEEQRQKAAAKS